MMFNLKVSEETLDTISKIVIGVALHLDEKDPQFLDKLMPIIEFIEATIGDVSVGSAICYIKVLEKLPQEIRRKMPREIYKYIQNHLFEIEETLGEKIPEHLRPEVIVTKKAQILGADGSVILEV